MKQHIQIECLREFPDPNMPASGVPQNVIDALHDAGFEIQATRITTINVPEGREGEEHPLAFILRNLDKD